MVQESLVDASCAALSHVGSGTLVELTRYSSYKTEWVDRSCSSNTKDELTPLKVLMRKRVNYPVLRYVMPNRNKRVYVCSH